MKILYFDSMFPKGHKVINERYLDIFSKMQADVYVCAEDGWFDFDEHFHQVKRKWVRPCNRKIQSRLQILVNLLKILKVIKKVQPDVIYVASYDIISILFALPLLYRYRKIIYLQEHNNVDQLENRIKYRTYSVYKNMFYHLVFEEYIKEKLVSYGVRGNLISIVPHPIPNAYLCSEVDDKSLEDLEYYAVGLSNSNSDELVQDIVNEQKNVKFLNSTKYKIVLKSNNIDYEDEHLKVIHGWISSNDYSRYCRKCKYFVIPFPERGYSYRVSNVFMEAISNGKKVISSRFPLVEYYTNKYRDICLIYDHVDDIPRLLNQNMPRYTESRLQFIEDHSDNKILNAFCSAFDGRDL